MFGKKFQNIHLMQIYSTSVDFTHYYLVRIKIRTKQAFIGWY